MKKTFVGSSIAIVDGLLNRYCDNQGTTSSGKTTYVLIIIIRIIIKYKIIILYHLDF